MRAGPAARRLRMRARPGSARRAWAALCLGLALAGSAAQAGGGCGPDPSSSPGTVEGSLVRLGEAVAAYEDLTGRYGHGVLGDALEPETLRYWSPALPDRCGVSVTLDQAHVFEDLAPRLADLDGDSLPEVITVRSHRSKGAQIAVYGLRGGRLELIAQTPYIGRSHRWLAPVGAADLDGDGHVEIAYIDRPHLARILRIWRFEDGKLSEAASAPGLTNHRIGQDFITSGIRDCGQGPELVTVSGGWRRVMASRLQEGGITTRDIGPYRPDTGLRQALACR
ncbi:VCBS repeat-containing protein [Leisingera caerulea]|nr:VCBS repeat-containing protein [Leisingera caerulea]